ncbi:hypothetical protein DBV15_09259, partial [Temnothorax longispinosus]
PSGARHPTPRPGPLLPTPSSRLPADAARVHVFLCTLLHEPRPFTEGPRNATALNNHPPEEDRRPLLDSDESLFPRFPLEIVGPINPVIPRACPLGSSRNYPAESIFTIST